VGLTVPLAMKNIYEVLRQKEMDLMRVRGEIDALRTIIPLLAESNSSVVHPPETFSSRVYQGNKWPLQVGEHQPISAEPT
jgi:hypothetical protein